MEGEIPCKPEAVWLLEDENVLTLLKEEPETDTVSDCEGASFDLKPVKKEFFEDEAEEAEPEDESAHTSNGGQDMCCKLEIEDNSILEDSSGCEENPELGGLQVKDKVAESAVEATDHSEPDIKIPVQKKGYKCHICYMGFTRVVDLVQHTRKSHTEAKPFMCRHCEKCFENRSVLNDHKRTHTGEAPFSCEHCDKLFKRGSNLIVHIRTHTGEKPFSCEHCNKCFARSSDVTAHRKTHTGEKPFSCEHCNKCFARSSGLFAHRRTHTGEKPFLCEYCNKCFTHTSALTVHRRTHTGEKPFSCDYCKKSFTQSSALIAHRRMHTGEKPFSCDYCSKSYALRSALNKHLRTHRGE